MIIELSRAAMRRQELHGSLSMKTRKIGDLDDGN